MLVNGTICETRWFVVFSNRRTDDKMIARFLQDYSKVRQNLQSWALRWRRAAVLRDSMISVIFYLKSYPKLSYSFGLRVLYVKRTLTPIQHTPFRYFHAWVSYKVTSLQRHTWRTGEALNYSIDIRGTLRNISCPVPSFVKPVPKELRCSGL